MHLMLYMKMALLMDNEQYSSFPIKHYWLKQCSRHRSSDRVSQSDKLFTAKSKASTGIELKAY